MIECTVANVIKVIRSLDPNEVHGHNMISMRMLRLCDSTLCKRLSIIFKDNVVPMHKKADTQFLKNYCPVFLLPICGQIRERLSDNALFSYFTENDLISQYQFGFKSGESYS